MGTGVKLLAAALSFLAVISLAFHNTFNCILLLVLAAIVLAISNFRHHHRQSKLYKGILILLCLFILSFAAVEGWLLYHSFQSEPPQESTYVIVLGAGLWGERLSPILHQRMETALEYLTLYPNAKIIVSGGQGDDEPFPEAHAMRDFLIQRGITENRILLEDRSTSTKENIQYSAQILETLDKGDPSITLITSDYHMPRALLMAQSQNLHAVGFRSKTPRGLLTTLLPREYFAWIKTLLFDLR